jgi:hypothetical protein
MIERAGIDVGSDDGNIEDVDEQVDFNKLHPAITDTNGLPISMSKSGSGLPPI